MAETADGTGPGATLPPGPGRAAGDGSPGPAAAEPPAEASYLPAAIPGDVSLRADDAQRRLIAAPFRTGLLAGLGLLLAYALYLSLSTILSTLIVLALSIIIAVGLDPVVALLMRRGLRRGLAVAITFLAMLGVLVGALYAIIPPIAQEVAAFIAGLPKRLEALQNDPTIRSLDEKFGLIGRLQEYVAGIGPGAASGVFTAAGVAVDLLVVLVLTLYFLAGLPRITESAYRLLPASRRERVRALGQTVIKQIGGYLGGATLIALQAGVVAALFAWIIGLPYPLAIGSAAFVLDFVPVVGPVVIGLSMVLLGFTQSIVIGIVAGVFYLGQHLFEAYWLYPRVMRRTVHISSAAVIVAIVVGAALLGVMGAVLAVPVAAALQLVIRDVLQPRQDQA